MRSAVSRVLYVSRYKRGYLHLAEVARNFAGAPRRTAFSFFFGVMIYRIRRRVVVESFQRALNEEKPAKIYIANLRNRRTQSVRPEIRGVFVHQAKCGSNFYNINRWTAEYFQAEDRYCDESRSYY